MDGAPVLGEAESGPVPIGTAGHQPQLTWWERHGQTDSERTPGADVGPEDTSGLTHISGFLLEELPLVSGLKSMYRSLVCPVVDGS